MIRAASTLELPFSGVVGNPIVRASHQLQPRGHLSKAESEEAEISRLTWAVIDCVATDNDRKRLAELVAAQHALRHK